MNIKYFYEFKGQDNILNRVEILTNKTAVAQEITVSYTPFLLEYSEVKKLTPIQGSGATLNLISKTIFQFENLHTDNMQEYLVKFYRGGLLYWMGWLDPELYEENLALYPPYPVEFTAADFNVLERLKFTDSFDKNYTDIAPFITQLKRCFDKLSLPFNKLYIGCTTVAEGVSLSSNETLFHKLYIQSTNFYDEDNKPMSCKEVIESILQPFGLIMVQRDASVYIYDYNTIVLNLKMKVYDFNTLTYLSEESVSFILGDMAEIGFRSSNSPYGFEDLINNVSITSSLYGDINLIDKSVKEGSLSDLKSENETDILIKQVYSKCLDWNAQEYILYKSKETNGTLLGAKMIYSGNKEENNWIFQNYNSYIASQSENIYMCLKCKAYINTKINPFDNNEKVEEPESTRRMLLYCKVLLVYGGQDLMYYNGVQWKSIEAGKKTEYTTLVYMNSGNWRDTRVINTWLTNSTVYWTGTTTPNTVIDREKDFGAGLKIPLPPKSGYIKIIIDYARIDNNSDVPNIFRDVKDLLIDTVSITFEDIDGKSISTDDYEFRSYINRNVVTDLEEITLKCISANEKNEPIGKANILSLNQVSDSYKYHTIFTRSGQTDILERLLLCTIHSNYTRKNKKFTVDIKTTDNPAMRYSTLKNRWPDDKFLTSGCRIDFNQAITNLTVYNFSEDTDKLSDIPYE